MRLSFSLLMSVLIGCASGGSDGDSAPRGPGQQEWTLVPKAQVDTECGLDPALLEQADAEIRRAYAVVRYGKLCHEFYPTYAGDEEAFCEAYAAGDYAPSL